MKTRSISCLAFALICLPACIPVRLAGQSDDRPIREYFSGIPRRTLPAGLQKYRMTAVYLNRDLYGNFTGKTKITGDYTRGFEKDTVSWQDIFISHSASYDGTFPAGNRQEYMENMRYVPSPSMLEEKAFARFPANPESTFAKNLVWDMMAIEEFAWNHLDSLKLNRSYEIPEPGGQFNMAGIGNYSQPAITLCWTGISSFNGELCAVVGFNAIDNRIELTMEALRSRGTEQYWGTIWISLDSNLIQYADMYGGTIQEIEIQGMQDKFLVKTIRELKVDKIL